MPNRAKNSRFPSEVIANARLSSSWKTHFRLNAIFSKAMMAELTATGGVLLLGIAISSLLEIKKIRVGNFLPALVLAPLIVWIVSLF